MMRSVDIEPEENLEELLRMVGSSVDEMEKFITAEDYLKPRDRKSDHPLSNHRSTGVSMIAHALFLLMAGEQSEHGRTGGLMERLHLICTKEVYLIIGPLTEL